MPPKTLWCPPLISQSSPSSGYLISPSKSRLTPPPLRSNDRQAPLRTCFRQTNRIQPAQTKFTFSQVSTNAQPHKNLVNSFPPRKHSVRSASVKQDDLAPRSPSPLFPKVTRHIHSASCSPREQSEFLPETRWFRPNPGLPWSTKKGHTSSSHILPKFPTLLLWRSEQQTPPTALPRIRIDRRMH